MTLNQIKYIIEVAHCSSISKAAENLFITQPSLSKAISDLENEMEIKIFYRNNRGVFLTDDGSKFLSYARQIAEQVDLLETRYKEKQPIRRCFAISSQHYAFVVNAFVELVKEYNRNEYEFSLRESRTYDIIEDVRTGKSELGILYLSNFNRNIINRLIANSDLTFEHLFYAKPHVFVYKDNPLAKRESVTIDDLKAFPRLSYEQGEHNSFYFSEELHSIEETPKNIIVSDRATLFNLLIGLEGYTISSGILSSDLNGNDIVSVPLISDEQMDIGYIVNKNIGLSRLAREYVIHLERYIGNYTLAV